MGEDNTVSECGEKKKVEMFCLIKRQDGEGKFFAMSGIGRSRGYFGRSIPTDIREKRADEEKASSEKRVVLLVVGQVKE